MPRPSPRQASQAEAGAVPGWQPPFSPHPGDAGSEMDILCSVAGLKAFLIALFNTPSMNRVHSLLAFVSGLAVWSGSCETADEEVKIALFGAMNFRNKIVISDDIV